MTETRRRLENLGLLLFTLVALFERDVRWLCGYGAILTGVERPRWRLADAVTTLRAVVLGAALVIARSTSTPSWAAAGLTLFLLLDGLDGWLARRAKEADVRGARLDVRFDAWAIVAAAVALYQLGRIPLWALVPGALRPLLQLLPAPPSLGQTPRRVAWGRWAFTAFVVVLIVAGVSDAPWLTTVIALATFGITASLLSDLWLVVPPMWQRPATRGLIIASLAWFVGHATLFVPGFLAFGGTVNLLPFVPATFSNGQPPTWRWAALSWYLYDLFVSRVTSDPFRFNVELAIAMALVLLLPHKRIGRYGVTIAWCVGMLVMVYDSLPRRISGRGPAWEFDLKLLPSAIRFLKAVYGTVTIWLAGLGLVLVILGAALAISRGTRWFAEQVATVPQRHRAAWAGAGVAAVLAAFAVGKDQPPITPVAYSTTAKILQNLRDSEHISKNIRPDENLERHAAQAPSWTFEKPTAERPDLLLFLIESYGRLAWRPPYREQWLRQLARYERGWRERGWSIRSNWSEAPVCGGGSWLSASSLLLMYPVWEPFTYDTARRGKSHSLAESLSLLTHLGEAGYHNVTLQPVNQMTPKEITWGTHVQVDRADLPYTGPPFGLAYVPDQYSLWHTHRAHPPKADQPYALFFETGSSHAPWWVPPLLPTDRALDSDAYFNPSLGRSLELPDAASPWLKSLAYTFGVIDDYLTCCARPNAVAVILGDHQPPGLGACEAGDRAVPVHFVTRTDSDVASEATKDWQEGLGLTGDAGGAPPSLTQYEVGTFILRRLGAAPVSKQETP